MAKKFLSGIDCNTIKIEDAPIVDTDGTNKLYVDGISVPSGGTIGQVLKKVSNTDHDLEWSDWDIVTRDYDATISYHYYGYEYADGSWGVLRVDVSTYSRTRSSGPSDYATAWTNRVGLTYI